MEWSLANGYLGFKAITLFFSCSLEPLLPPLYIG
jgi:hypothetical protein